MSKPGYGFPLLALGAALMLACQPAAPTGGPVPQAAATAAPQSTSGGTAATAAVDVDALYEAAKREGEVVIYSSNNIDDMRHVLAQFQARYPEVKPNHVRASSEDLVRRLVTETRGGRTLADVFESNALSFSALLDEDLIEPFFPPQAATLPADSKDPGGRWYAEALSHDVMAYNTNQIQRGEVPRTWEQAGDPKYRGRLMMEPSDQIAMIALWQRKYNGDLNRVKEVFTQVAKNDPTFNRGHSEATELLASGERPIFAGAYFQPVLQVKEKGAPVDWLTEGEAVIIPSVVGVVRNGPHPNAARLYTNWILSDEGQRAFATRQRPPARPGIGDTPTFAQQYVFAPEFSQYHDQIRAEWQQIFGLR
jgi:iron(III) transport system substrate-binding protein